MALRIHVRAPIRSTEDPEKVRVAITEMFPGAQVEMTPTQASAIAPSFARLKELIRAYRIPDTARGQMLMGLAPGGLRSTFLLGKQAAAVGRAHFGSLRSPLGDIEVSILGDEESEVERFIYETAPDTTCAPELAEIPPALRPIP